MKKKPKTRQRQETRQPDLLSRPWTAFVLCERDPRQPEAAVYRNSRYQVSVRRMVAQDGGPDMLHLSFKRLDQGVVIPYRDKMRLKDEFVGPEAEGVELLPARSREVDTANQFHLWIVDSTTFRFPFGFTERYVSDVSIEGTKQQPWPEGERPSDCLSRDALLRLMKEGK